ncbi:hypothetical protein ILYODFUR_027686 [Ilyodon furcidens]|uniref:Uncharacterized protein n=1 Tax=Ilyodon furcidens TaxID=33524 RepID=A0ABV0T264_9TELE
MQHFCMGGKSNLGSEDKGKKQPHHSASIRSCALASVVLQVCRMFVYLFILNDASEQSDCIVLVRDLTATVTLARSLIKCAESLGTSGLALLHPQTTTRFTYLLDNFRNSI